MKHATTTAVPSGAEPFTPGAPFEAAISVPELELRSRFGPFGAATKRFVARLIRFAIAYQATVNRAFASYLNDMLIRIDIVEKSVDHNRAEVRALSFERARFAMLAERIEELGRDWDELQTSNGLVGTPAVRMREAVERPLRALEDRFDGLAASIDTLTTSLDGVDERTLMLEKAASSAHKVASQISLDQKRIVERLSELEREAPEGDDRGLGMLSQELDADRTLVAAILERVERLEGRARGSASAADANQSPVVERLDALGTRIVSSVEALGARLDARMRRLDERLGGSDAPSSDLGVAGRDELDAFARELRTTTEALSALIHRLRGEPYMSRAVYADVDGPIAQQAEFDYVGFENIFRGPETLISERQAVYLPFFEPGSRAVDVGCGRGEFVELLSQAGVDVVGIDSNESMVEHCRRKGLDKVIKADALAYLGSESGPRFGGIFCAQVIEHLSFDDLYQFLKSALDALEPGGLLIAETVNPSSLEGWKTFFVDPTHIRPLFPETMQFMCRSAGFAEARVFYPNGAGFVESEGWMQGEYAIIARKSPLNVSAS